VGSPLEGIADYEREHGVPHNYINVVMYALRRPNWRRRLRTLTASTAVVG